MHGTTIALVLLLLIALTLAFARGERASKVLAAFLIVRLIIEVMLNLMFGSYSYVDLNIRNLIFDIVQVAVIIFLLLRHKRTWIFACLAIQSFAIIGHLAPVIGLPGMRRAYWVMLNVPVIAQVAVLSAVTFNAERRGKNRSATSRAGS